MSLRGLIDRMTTRRGLAAITVLAVAGAAAFAAGWFARPAPAGNAVGYGALRVAVVNAHLREVRAPYAFFAGDSYVELAPLEPLSCGLDVVNGGLSGLKTADYLAAWRKVRFERPPAAILLAIGTNDLLLKHAPSGRSALARFRADAEALVAALAATGARLVVAAVPPIPAALRPVFDPAGFELYSDVLRDACGRHDCRFVDPYAAARGAEFWRGREGTSPDGLHLGNLRAAYATVAGALCR